LNRSYVAPPSLVSRLLNIASQDNGNAIIVFCKTCGCGGGVTDPPAAMDGHSLEFNNKSTVELSSYAEQIEHAFSDRFADGHAIGCMDGKIVFTTILTEDDVVALPCPTCRGSKTGCGDCYMEGIITLISPEHAPMPFIDWAAAREDAG